MLNIKYTWNCLWYNNNNSEIIQKINTKIKSKLYIYEC